MSRQVVKRLLRRARSDADVAKAIDDYLVESPAAAPGLIAALEAAFDYIQRRPASGSSRYAFELNLPGLRCWPCKRYPYLIFYAEKAGHIEVWRVLYASGDIPRWLQSDDDAAPTAR